MMFDREGWCDRGYLQLFREESVLAMTDAYSLGAFLPGMVAIGLIGWDDLLVRDSAGLTWTVPTLPMRSKYLENSVIDINSEVIPDRELTGKIKWYVSPLLFGGSPTDASNIIWVDLEKHCELVCWWNTKYEEIKTKT
jgi:hypothetical protein